MSLPRSVAEVLAEHVTVQVEGIDRMCLSSALMDPISKHFVAALEEFAQREKIPIVPFRKGQRKTSLRNISAPSRGPKE